MTKNLLLPAVILAGAILILAAILLFKPFNTVLGAGYFGQQVHIQTATTTAVGPDTVKTLFADETSPTCHSRVVTTAASGIYISFDDVTGFGSTTLASGVGHWQASSSTVAYDSGLYGCGLMTAFGVSSSTLTISSF